MAPAMQAKADSTALSAKTANRGSAVPARRSAVARGSAGRGVRAPLVRAAAVEPARAPADEKTVQTTLNTIRFLAVDAVQKASSGHPGLPMGAAAAGYVLYKDFMNHNPSNPFWFNRDRFVLSAGHGCMLQYALMHLCGYNDVTMDEIKQFRQYGSKTPGHPEGFDTAGVEATTGPLGTGISCAVGMAAAERHLAARFNKPDAKVVDHYTYVISSDGDSMEGVQQEAISWAGHQGLGKLIVLYDDNNITIDGHTDLAFSEDVLSRYQACGWHVQHVPNGSTDVEGLRKAIEAAKKVEDKPSIIKMTTLIGYGSPNKNNTHDVHGAPLGEEEVAATRENLGWSHEPFEVPQEAYDHMGEVATRGKQVEEDWKKQLEDYEKKYPEDAKVFKQLISREVPQGWEEALPAFSTEDKPMATRQISQQILNAIAPELPGFLGGSADLAPSNNTLMKAYGDMQRNTPEERNVRFGVREFGMSQISNGIALHGSGLIPYAATFTIFTDFMRGGMRLAALQGCGVIFVTTHDSIGLGEDGPTHQPIEQLASLRTMPNMYVIRPADGDEVAGAYKIAVNRRDGPTTLTLTRQKVPNLANSDRDKVAYGAYSVYDTDPKASPDAIVIGTGSEVSIAMEGAQEFEQQGKKVRVVSFPCWELFERQPKSYRDSVLPPGVPTVSIEAGCTFCWDRYAHTCVGIDRFGASAPGPVLYEKLGITKEAVLEALRSVAQ